ncbi:tRNA (guanosine(46)-N7)-methyltransferase TrmB [Melioribacter sp. OK-6-Me]|uniref:tRNA (guanosine(46)-N7)-methyltransferase TrmB n=1 Tax=unclassified Melioribacter TaxID=2627329 RepID=UPI003ED8CE0B
MPRRKLRKLLEVRTFENVFDAKSENVEEKLRSYLNNTEKVTLELGCGQADYSINLAQLYPDRYFIGIDRKAARIWNASKNADDKGIKNAAFLISYIERLDEVFKTMKAEEIWITFPDPYPRRSSMKKRLTHPRFLEVYKKIMTPGAVISLKTDDDTLYEYTLSVVEEENLKLIKALKDLYSEENLSEEEKIRTKYENQHIADGKKIKLVRFTLD